MCRNTRCTCQGIGLPALHLQPRRSAPDIDHCQIPRRPLHLASMLHTLILVLYCTGLRLGEAVRLRMSDVDLDRGILMIERSKGRSRIVAIRADLVTALRGYAAERQRVVQGRRRADPEAFFPSAGCLPTDRCIGIECDPAGLLRRLGIKPPDGRIGARPYEFRHAFCRASAHGLGEGTASTSTPSCHRCRRISDTRASSGPRSI